MKTKTKTLALTALGLLVALGIGVYATGSFDSLQGVVKPSPSTSVSPCSRELVFDSTDSSYNFSDFLSEVSSKLGTSGSLACPYQIYIGENGSSSQDVYICGGDTMEASSSEGQVRCTQYFADDVVQMTAILTDGNAESVESFGISGKYGNVGRYLNSDTYEVYRVPASYFAE